MVLTPHVGRLSARPDPVRAFLSPATWLATAHLLLDFFVGWFSAIVLFFGLMLSVVLLPFALLGVPVWIVTAWVSAMLAKLERARYRVLLGVDIPVRPMPPGTLHPLRYGGVLLRDAGVRRRAAYQVLAAPLGLLTSGAVYFVLCLGFALLLVPVVAMVGYAPQFEILGMQFGDSAAGRTFLAGLGLILLLLAPAIIRALALMDVAVANALLGHDASALERRVDELERSRARVVDAGEVERRRIERDLHDGTQQQLVSLAMTLGRAKARYKQNPEEVGELLDDAHKQAKDTVTDLRSLIRGLHPPVLADRGLDAALSAIAARCPVPVTLTVELDQRPPATVEAIGYFVVAEGLTNVAKHANASTATVTVRREGTGPVWITITDNGVGGADPDRGTGLRGLADRVSGVDGQLSVDSPLGGPTVLTVELPSVELPRTAPTTVPVAP
ncbi:sensor histidine kinase [Pseudonocardia sp. TRM90224]|uniref:sensor histidine kinase n=1 Tax=Pseudonocardia sp. TRM90224 TaxID=2812678 RepID=UPI001E6581DC|nr:sensor histidine kinase [Pseudonocardia sp. TRM90224]